jgi:hypothetical protein
MTPIGPITADYGCRPVKPTLREFVATGALVSFC